MNRIEELFKQYHKPLVQFLMPLVKERAVAEDIVQDVFVRLWTKGEHFTFQVSARSYIFKSAYNRAINHIESQKVQSPVSSAENLPQPPEKDPGAAEEITRLHQAIDELPPQCRAVLILAKLEGHTYREIAKILEISSKTVEKHMGKALKTLREAMERVKSGLSLLFFS